MKNIKKLFCIALAIFLIASTFSACSSTSTSLDFIYPFNGDINSFDPQVASTSDEFLVIENCFEGLIRINDNGKVQSGCATSWEISKDNKTYTFHIKQGLKWHIVKDGYVQKLMGEDFNPDITAHDFVFALQRAVEKNTNAPEFSSISNIKNADKIHSGKLSSSKLGVKATDDYTLEIKLSSADDSFLNVLTTAIAMPCNEEFFNSTKGRYGLGLEYSIFNGQFYISSILESSYVLEKNDEYNGEHPTNVTDLTFNIIDDATENVPKKLKSGYYDCAYIDGKEYESIKNSGVTATKYSNKTLAFLLNQDVSSLSNQTLRKAVCLSISNIDTSNVDYLQNATTFTPTSCTVNGEEASKAIGKTIPSQNLEKAKELWKKEIENQGLTEANFTVICTEYYEDITKQLVQGIQAGVGSISSYGDDDEPFSFSLKIEVLSESDYYTALSKGDYDLALYEFESVSQSSGAFLNSIVNCNYVEETDTMSKAIRNLEASKSSNLASNLNATEKAILKSYTVFPVLYESSYYAMAQGVSDVDFHPGSGRVCFVNASREE